MLPFEFVIDGPPVSQQARRRERVRQWREEVRRVAAQQWPTGELPVATALMLTIVHFYDTVSLDLDNLPKPIVDALKGLVYLDDSQITDVICRKRHLRRDIRVDNPSDVLADGFSRGTEFLYIVVEDAPDQEGMD